MGFVIFYIIVSVLHNTHTVSFGNGGSATEEATNYTENKRSFIQRHHYINIR